MMIAAAFFFVSLFLTSLLFALKLAEARRGARYLPTVRESADTMALRLKARLMEFRHSLALLPPALVVLSRYVLHELALAAARVAKATEMQLHRAADMVSHKRAFEKREPKNEFLKKVEEVKNGNGHDERAEL